VIDMNDERSVQQVIEKACPDERVRETALLILAEAIKEADVYGRHKWAIRVGETARLVVGNYYVCTVRETGVWIALDDRFTKTGDYWPTMDELNSWGWMPDEPGSKGSYSNYKDKSRRTNFSINGRYSVGENHNGGIVKSCGSASPVTRRPSPRFLPPAPHY